MQSFTKKKPAVNAAPPEKKPPSPLFESPDAYYKKSADVLTLPHIMSQFRDIRGNQRISLKVLLLSGTSASSLKTKIINKGTAVLIETKFPSTFVSVPHHIQNLRNMTNDQVHFSETDGRITAFHDAVSSLQHHGSSDEIWGKMVVELPLQCEQQFHRDTIPPIDLGWYDTIQVLSLELMGVRSNFQEQYESIKMRAPSAQQQGFFGQQASENNQNAQNSSSQCFGSVFGGGMGFSGGKAAFTQHRSVPQTSSTSSSMSQTLCSNSPRSKEGGEEEEEEKEFSFSIPPSIGISSMRPPPPRSPSASKSIYSCISQASISSRMSQREPTLEELRMEKVARSKVQALKLGENKFIPSPSPEKHNRNNTLYGDERNNIAIESFLRANEEMFESEINSANESSLEEDGFYKPSCRATRNFDHAFASECPNAAKLINQGSRSDKKSTCKDLIYFSPTKRSKNGFARNKRGKRQKLSHKRFRNKKKQRDNSPRNVSHDSSEIDDSSTYNYVV